MPLPTATLHAHIEQTWSDSNQWANKHTRNGCCTRRTSGGGGWRVARSRHDHELINKKLQRSVSLSAALSWSKRRARASQLFWRQQQQRSVHWYICHLRVSFLTKKRHKEIRCGSWLLSGGVRYKWQQRWLHCASTAWQNGGCCCTVEHHFNELAKEVR